MTVPPKGAPSNLLWERFAQVLELDPAAFELNVRANRSIGLATAMTLRHLNEILGRDGTPAADHKFYDLLVKHLLTKRGLVSRQGEPTLGVDERWVIKRGAAEVAALRKQGHRVIGDLDELLPQPVRGVHPNQVSIHATARRRDGGPGPDDADRHGARGQAPPAAAPRARRRRNP